MGKDRTEGDASEHKKASAEKRMSRGVKGAVLRRLIGKDSGWAHTRTSRAFRRQVESILAGKLSPEQQEALRLAKLHEADIAAAEARRAEKVTHQEMLNDYGTPEKAAAVEADEPKTGKA